MQKDGTNELILKFKSISYYDFDNFYRELEDSIRFNYSTHQFPSFKKVVDNNIKHNLAMISMRPYETNRKYIEYTKPGLDDPFKFATDNLFAFQYVVAVSRYIFFYEAIQTTLKRLFESGIIQLMMKEEVQEVFENLTIHQKQEPYSTLTWNHLYPGFYLWFAAVIVCILVFFGEFVLFFAQAYILKLRSQ